MIRECIAIIASIKEEKMLVLFKAIEFSHTREREPNERNSEKIHIYIYRERGRGIED